MKFFAVILSFAVVFVAARAQTFEHDPSFDDRELVRLGVKSITRWNGDEVDFFREYDGSRRIVRECDAFSGRCTEYHYDELGRLSRRIYRGNERQEWWTGWWYEYDREGRPVRILRSDRWDNLDERVVGIFRYDSTGRRQEAWSCDEENVLSRVYVADSTWERTTFSRRSNYYHESDFELVGQGESKFDSTVARYANDGTLIELRGWHSRRDRNGERHFFVEDGPCRRITVDTVWENWEDEARTVRRASRKMIDTCARRSDLILYSRELQAGCNVVDFGKLFAVWREEAVLDQHGRPLRIERYESWPEYDGTDEAELENAEIEIEWNGTDSPPIFRQGSEELAETRIIEYDERGLPVKQIVTQYEGRGMRSMMRQYETERTVLRYEYEFFTAEEKEGGVIH